MTRDEMKKRDSEKRSSRLYIPDYVATKLSEEEPFFKIGNGVYAVQTRSVMQEGKMVDVPMSFRRADKVRGLTGKAKKQAKQEARRKVRNAIKFNKQALGN